MNIKFLKFEIFGMRDVSVGTASKQGAIQVWLPVQRQQDPSRAECRGFNVDKKEEKYYIN